MKVTPLNDLVIESDGLAIVMDGDGWRVIEKLRSPAAGELIAVGAEAFHRYALTGEKPPFGLQFIGIHPDNVFLAIYSRSDCGLFWRSIALV